MKLFCRLLFVILITSFSAHAQHPAATVPDFTFYSLDQKPFTTKDLKPGKLLLIIFFDATCSHCQHAMDIYNQHYKELGKTAVYLVTLDNQEAIKNFMAKHANNLYASKNVTILQDRQNQFITKFGPNKYPSMFLFTPEKKLLMYDDEPNHVVNFLKAITERSR